jgi:hypothetical protein
VGSVANIPESIRKPFEVQENFASRCHSLHIIDGFETCSLVQMTKLVDFLGIEHLCGVDRKMKQGSIPWKTEVYEG